MGNDKLFWESEIHAYDTPHGRLRLIARVLQSLNIHSVFDIGCGHGYLGSLVGSATYSGCDMIDGAKATFPFFPCNINEDPLPSELAEFDAIVCSGILEYVDDLPLFLKQLFGRMSNRAWLVATYYNMNHISRVSRLLLGGSFGVHRGWRGFYSPRDVRRLIRDAGFLSTAEYVTRFGLSRDPGLQAVGASAVNLRRYFPGSHLFANQIIYVARVER